MASLPLVCTKSCITGFDSIKGAKKKNEVKKIITSNGNEG